jgi:hypothetical protein
MECRELRLEQPDFSIGGSPAGSVDETPDDVQTASARILQ